MRTGGRRGDVPILVPSSRHTDGGERSVVETRVLSTGPGVLSRPSPPFVLSKSPLFPRVPDGGKGQEGEGWERVDRRLS